VILGDMACSTGVLSVTGVDSTSGDQSELEVDEGALVVGDHGDGTLNIGRGGVVEVFSYLSLAKGNGSEGTVNLDKGGTLEVGGRNGIEAGAGKSRFNLDGGVVEVVGCDLTTCIAAELGNCTTSTIDTNGLNATWAGVIFGPGALDKSGNGTLTLTAANCYSGGTVISNGTLKLTNVLGGGSAVGLGPVEVEPDGTLAGNGTVIGDTCVSGNLSPGDGPGQITFDANLTLNVCSFTNLPLAGNTTPGVDYSTVNVLGNFTAGGTLNVTLLNGFTPSLGDTYNLFNVSGTIMGTFNTVDLPNLGGTLGWDTSQLYIDGVIAVSPVPEPALGALLLGAGMMGWSVWRRRR
jgi:autotransporter-associated beta strand protein/T5SS/PEP-CTERM-associated repeat protein